MNTVGIFGGGLLCELGPVSDAQAFFWCLNTYVVKKDSTTEYSLLTDRLYRRYLNLQDIDHARKLMTRVEEFFTKIPGKLVDWPSSGIDRAATCIEVDGLNLSVIFSKYFTCFEDCARADRGFFEDWRKSLPLRFIISDLAGFAEGKERPLDHYDMLTGDPFWLRNVKTVPVKIRNIEP